jgi:S1-C subfamily serine protease
VSALRLRVVHTFGRHAGTARELDKRVVRFGRAPENDVAFDPDYDRDASGLHAEVRREAEGWVLVDVGSRNGTFVRGRKIDRCPLENGDEITFGAHGPRVRIEIVAGASAAHADPVPSGAPRAKSGTVAMEPEPAALSRQPAKKKQPLPGTAAYPVVSLPIAGAPPAPPAPRAAPARAPQAAAPFPQAPRAGAPIVEAPPAGKRVGQRTIAALISSAVATARGRGPQKMNTRVLRDYVDREVTAATAGQRSTTKVLAVLLLASLAGLGGLVIWSRWSSDEIDRLRSDLASMSPDDPHRKEIEGRLGSLHPANASFGRNLYDQSKKGIFMLAAGGQGFCTAFAVRPSVLATNAHCVAAAKRQGGTIVALENEGRGGVSFSVSDLRQHPGYRDGENGITPDVGIVTISGHAATVLTMASAQELSSMGAGDDVYLIGFPGRLMDASNPTATFLAAHVGRITTAGGRPGGFADTWLVQHDAPTTRGTSGSPVFNGKGHVIAINAGGYMEGDEETVSGRKTEVVKASPYKFGMRIDLINAILR